jgi:hypothetical protein
MPEQRYHLADEPSETSVSLLIRSLGADCATSGVSPENHAHRSRVIRQQKELLDRRVAGDAAEKSKQLAKRVRKAGRAPDHREEGGQG